MSSTIAGPFAPGSSVLAPVPVSITHAVCLGVTVFSTIWRAALMPTAVPTSNDMRAPSRGHTTTVRSPAESAGHTTPTTSPSSLMPTACELVPGSVGRYS